MLNDNKQFIDKFGTYEMWYNVPFYMVFFESQQGFKYLGEYRHTTENLVVTQVFIVKTAHLPNGAAEVISRVRPGFAPIREIYKTEQEAKAEIKLYLVDRIRKTNLKIHSLQGELSQLTDMLKECRN